MCGLLLLPALALPAVLAVDWSGTASDKASPVVWLPNPPPATSSNVTFNMTEFDLTGPYFHVMLCETLL
jgi:hypothetical protein